MMSPSNGITQVCGGLVFQRGYFDTRSFRRQQGLAVPDRYLG